MTTLHDIYAIGNPIVDIEARVEPSFIRDLGVTKGVMTLVDERTAQSVVERLTGLLPTSDAGGAEPALKKSSGGSAANTAAGVCSFGGRAAFCGRARDDELGQFYARELAEIGVTYTTPLAQDGLSTAVAIIMVTPDADRTMLTYLGGCREFSERDIDPARIRQSQVVYVEGYLWDLPAAKQACLAAQQIAKKAGRKVALSLSDPMCVKRSRDEFLDLIEKHVDIVFANADEIRALFETDSLDTALRLIRPMTELSAITTGAAGSVLQTADERVDVPALPPKQLLDTTGAGDLYAAGVLHGVTSGKTLGEAGALGSLAASEVISHLGARPHVRLAELARKR